jgi:hypothetical protein
MRRRTLISATAVVAVAAGALVPATGGLAAPAKKTVTVSVADDYYSPVDVKIRSGEISQTAARRSRESGSRSPTASRSRPSSAGTR